MDDPREQPENQADEQGNQGQDEPIFPMPDLDMELREGLEEGEDGDE
jgi:hypothetical protein